MEKVYAVSYRDGVMLKLTEDYKYKSIRKTAEVLAELMSAAIPKSLKDVVVVPLPTIVKHIRERGFDHTLLLAKNLARLRGWRVERVIGRVNKTVQVGADEETRRRQAKEAYAVVRGVNAEATYLLIDDVWTTGASMEAATKAIKKAGAKKVAAAVVLIPED
ncbi:ComF family protein [Candidatus Saccharibacteria bacterium]|nr:ComF family protein [Candidatus Saccharibacteria bacterium]